MNEEITPAKWTRDTGDLLKDTLLNLAEGLTGILASKRTDLLLSVGHIFQSLRKGHFLSQFSKEWNDYRQKGEIKDDYMETNQHFECLTELLEFLDKDIPDENRFSILKRIFLTAATEKVSKRDSILPQQFMRICRQLSSGEAIVMNAAYKRGQQIKPNDETSTSARDWLNTIASQSDLKHPELVEIYELSLIQKHLLTPRERPDGSGVKVTPYYRLTELAYDICKYIANYEPEKKL